MADTPGGLNFKKLAFNYQHRDKNSATDDQNEVHNEKLQETNDSFKKQKISDR